MCAFVDWLKQGATYRQLWRMLLPLIVLLHVLSVTGRWVNSFFFTPVAIMSNEQMLADAGAQTPMWLYLAVTTIYGPFVEEVASRLIPFTIVFAGINWLKARDSNIAAIVVLLTLVGTSAMFGLSHMGIVGLLMQGLGGLVLGTVFLKWSAYGESLSKVMKGFAAALILHGAYNASIPAISFLVYNVIYAAAYLYYLAT